MKDLDKEQLQDRILEWVKINLGVNFKFREYQFETIVDICTNILEDVNHTQLIEAPTGSGKSLLNVISAGVLADYYERSSYILCSDLYLWKQYEDLLKSHPKVKKKFGILKGQTGNYSCARNNEDMRNADCSMGGVSWGELFDSNSAINLGYACAITCPYIKARRKAAKAKVTIMTYQLYHFMVNVVAKIAQNKCAFTARDIIFCDECHNIPDIVRKNFKPEIKKSDIRFFETLYNYGLVNDDGQLELFNTRMVAPIVDKENDEKMLNEYYNSFDEIKNIYYKMWELISDEYSSKEDIDNGLNMYFDLLDKIKHTITTIEQDLRYKKQVLHESFNSSDVKFYKACSFFRNIMCFWNDFRTCILTTGLEPVLRSIEDSRLLKEIVVGFENAREDVLCYHFLLSTAHCQVLMSATIGGYDAYAENVGFKFIEEAFTTPEEEIQYTVIPSTFDFEKSPVNFLNRHKMSYRNKYESMQMLKPIIYKICENKYHDERGMIQTGSYANAKEIYDNAPIELQKRMLLYNNSKEKTQMITIHQMSTNTILIGPTLVEGIDLPGDQCRFIIILKVPYPVITDEYVKKKMTYFPMWYNSATSNVIIQGIGRGNRFKEDYCTTYILDACFLSLYNATKSQYPDELQQRIKIFN